MKPLLPFKVLFPFHGVLAAIHFNHESPFKTDEIHDVLAYPLLAAKLEAFQLLISKSLPESFFSLGGVPPELS